MEHTITAIDVNVALNSLLIIASSSDSKLGKRKKLEFNVLTKEYKFSDINDVPKFTSDQEIAIKWYNKDRLKNEKR